MSRFSADFLVFGLGAFAPFTHFLVFDGDLVFEPAETTAVVVISALVADVLFSASTAVLGFDALVVVLWTNFLAPLLVAEAFLSAGKFFPICGRFGCMLEGHAL